jgi:hypothetical protein
MNVLRRAGWGLLAVLTVAACNSPPQKADQAGGGVPAARPGEVTLAVVKWPELDKAIASHKGHVVVLDVWGEF